MNRADFQRLAEIRLAEAGALLDAGQWSGAYYLCGYAVECGLKACIAKLTQADDFPPPRSTVEDCYSHNFEKLIRAAGLTGALLAETKADAQFERNWSVTREWSEQSRYVERPEGDARDLMTAIGDPEHGVLRWIRSRW